MAITSGLKNINMLSKEKYDSVADPSMDELYAVSGSGTGFPSDKYIDLTLGASGSEYEAPANGYFYFSKNSSAAGQYAILTSGTDGIPGEVGDGTATTGYGIHIIRPVRKGVSVIVKYTLAGATNYFRFVYAEGE